VKKVLMDSLIVKNVDAVVKDLWMKVKRAPHKEPVFARQDIKETNVNYVLKDIISQEVTCLKNVLSVLATPMAPTEIWHVMHPDNVLVLKDTQARSVNNVSLASMAFHLVETVSATWRDQSIRAVIMMVFVHAKMESMVIDAPDANVICLASQIVKIADVTQQVQHHKNVKLMDNVNVRKVTVDKNATLDAQKVGH